jgi:hypothetical protein
MRADRHTSLICFNAHKQTIVPIIDQMYMLNCNAEIWAPRGQRLSAFGGTGEEGKNAIKPRNLVDESEYRYHLCGSLKIYASQTTPWFWHFQP